MRAHLHNLTGAGRETPSIMDSAVILLLASSCFTWSSAIYTSNREGPRKLKHLVEPLAQADVVARRGANATLPCTLRTRPSHSRVKWTKLEAEPALAGRQNVITVSDGRAFRRYGRLGPRASLPAAHAMDASLQLHGLQLGDGGEYRCELIHGIEDENVVVTLRIEGVVFPYQSKNGRYSFTLREAVEACAQQDGALASYQQLFRAWTEGLDWCSAGWLRDGSVRYPVVTPRPACGGQQLPPGIRSYGPKDRDRDRFDAFCFTSQTSGSVSYISGSFSLEEAGLACRRQGGALALVGHLYAAWRFQRYDRCDGGWLRDGSVRFPISSPRGRCGGVAEAGVRSFGFPDEKARLHGAYCYR